jgi:hypothetical protein
MQTSFYLGKQKKEKVTACCYVSFWGGGGGGANFDEGAMRLVFFQSSFYESINHAKTCESCITHTKEKI